LDGTTYGYLRFLWDPKGVYVLSIKNDPNKNLDWDARISSSFLVEKNGKYIWQFGGPRHYLTTKVEVSDGGKFLKGESYMYGNKPYVWVAVLTTPMEKTAAFKTISGFSAPWLRKNSSLDEFVIPKNDGVHLKKVAPF